VPATIPFYLDRNDFDAADGGFLGFRSTSPDPQSEFSESHLPPIGGELAELEPVVDENPIVTFAGDPPTGIFGPVRDFVEDIPARVARVFTPSGETSPSEIIPAPLRPAVGGELAEIDFESLNPADTTTPNGDSIVPLSLFDTLIQGFETITGIDLPFIGLDFDKDGGGRINFTSPTLQQQQAAVNPVNEPFAPTLAQNGTSVSGGRGCGCVIPKAAGMKISDITCRASQFIGRRISSRTINSMVREIGFEKARGALGLSVAQLGSVVAQRSRRRSRGITAADKRTSLRTLRSVKSLNKAFGIHSHSRTRKK